MIQILERSLSMTIMAKKLRNKFFLSLLQTKDYIIEG